MAVEVKSVSQILSGMVRRVLADTPLTDVTPGSVLSTILEAAAISDYQNNTSVIKILEANKLEKLIGSDLDTKAVEKGLSNGSGGYGRRPSTKARGKVRIGSSFEKVSTSIYKAKPAPFSGSLSVFVTDAKDWPVSGNIYIGRGSERSEGPIPYTEIIEYQNFWEIKLSAGAPLIKNHKYEDSVILAQGGKRLVTAGTRVQTPLSVSNTTVEYTIDDTVEILDGEAEIQVGITCIIFGEEGNAPAGSITSFLSSPFSGATVTNPLAISNGFPAESDENLRIRIQNHLATLSKGTESAIETALTGLRDTATGKIVTSANIVEPVSNADAAACYIDDGSGLEVTFKGKPYEVLKDDASGTETLFKTSNNPILPVNISNTIPSPFQLSSGDELRISIDGTIETFTVKEEDYLNIKDVSIQEIVTKFNDQSTNIGFRTLEDGQYLNIFDLSGKAETLQILPGLLQELLGLPTEEFRPLFLYRNNRLLSFKQKLAKIQTANYPWIGLQEADLQSVVIKVDGVESTFSINNSDFRQYSKSIKTASIEQFISVIKTKIAGVDLVKREINGGTVIEWSSRNLEGSLEVVSGGWVGKNKMWSEDGILSAIAIPQDYKLNRLTGNITLLSPLQSGEKLTAGTELTRATLYSEKASNGYFTPSFIPRFGNPTLVIGIDGIFDIKNINIFSVVLVNAVRLDPLDYIVELDFGAGNEDVIINLKDEDWIYLNKDTDLGAFSLPDGLVGLYKIKAIDGYKLTIVTDEVKAALFDTAQFQVTENTFTAFESSTIPQVIDLGNKALYTIDELVADINSQAKGFAAVKSSPRQLYIRSNNYAEGSIAIFAAIGDAESMWKEAVYVNSLQAHKAYIQSGTDLVNSMVTISALNDGGTPSKGYGTFGVLNFNLTQTTLLDGIATTESYDTTDYPVGLQEFNITGINAGNLYRVYNTETVFPYTGIYKEIHVAPFNQDNSAFSQDREENLALRLNDLPITYKDSISIGVDNSESFFVPFYKKAYVETLTGVQAGEGSLINFTLKDPDDPVFGAEGYRLFFDEDSVYNTFDFTDFNVYFRPMLFHPMWTFVTETKLPDFSTSPEYLMAKSNWFGKNHRLRLDIRLGDTAWKGLSVSHTTYLEDHVPIAHITAILPANAELARYEKAYTIQAMDYDDPDIGVKLVKLIFRSADGSAINADETWSAGNVLVMGGDDPEYSGSWFISEASTTEIHAIAPGIRKDTYPASPVKRLPIDFPLYELDNPGIPMVSLISSFNQDYLEESKPFELAMASNDDSLVIKFPTYLVSGSTVANTELTSIEESYKYHANNSYFGCSAHIYSYDNFLDEIKAVSHNKEAILPTSAELTDKTYTYRNEECYLVPANLKALKRWIDFTASNSISTSCEINDTEGFSRLQLASTELGTEGRIEIKGGTGNNTEAVPLQSFVQENNTGFLAANVETSFAQSIPYGSLLEFTSDVPIRRKRPYSTIPKNQDGYSKVTQYNTTDIMSSFPASCTVSYNRIDVNEGQFTFSVSEGSFAPGLSEIRFTQIENNLVKVDTTLDNYFPARTGDMLVIPEGVDADYSSVELDNVYNRNEDVYPGFPIVHVESSKEFYILADNPVDKTITINTVDDVPLFVPMFRAEKNIETNYQAGISFREKVVGSEYFYAKIMPIGGGLAVAKFNNGTDVGLNYNNLKLEEFAVSNDDFITFGEIFAENNQGTYRIVAHNNTDTIVFYNPKATSEISNNTEDWVIGPFGDDDTSAEDKRHIRIFDKDSVFNGDSLIISSASSTSSIWFPDTLQGNWTVKEIGLTNDYEPYVICDIQNAPLDSYNISLNTENASVYFREPVLTDEELDRTQSFKIMAGSVPTTEEGISKLYVFPKTNEYKLNVNNGIKVKSYKLDYPTIPVKGIDGYSLYTELLAEAYKVLSGDKENPVDYPGVRAIGAPPEVLPPLIKSIKLALDITVETGLGVLDVASASRAIATGYINNLKVGEPVIISELIRRIQQYPGIKSIVLKNTFPLAENGIIPVGSIETARILDEEDITI